MAECRRCYRVVFSFFGKERGCDELCIPCRGIETEGNFRTNYLKKKPPRYEQAWPRRFLHDYRNKVAGRDKNGVWKYPNLTFSLATRT